MPLDGKTCIVTGANSGLGLEVARHFVRMGCGTLILAVRTLSKGQAALENIKTSHPTSDCDMQVWELDMSKLSSVKAFADRVNTELPHLDIAILNAGLASRKWEISPDGWEQTIQVNCLSTTYLALLLLPKLQAQTQMLATKPSSFPPHLTIVASDVHIWTQFPERHASNIIHELNDKSKFRSFERYRVSKLINVYMTEAISVLKQSDGIVVNCVTPGLCRSELLRERTGISGMVFDILKGLLGRTCEAGARTIVYAGTEAGYESNGMFLATNAIAEKAPQLPKDQHTVLRRRVWKELLEILVHVDGEMKAYF